MATRTPLTIVGSDLQQMTAAQITEIINRTVWEYRNSPSVDLSVVASGGTLGFLSDTRKTAGAALNRATGGDFVETDTEEPGTVTVNYDRISQITASTSAPTDTSNIAFPAYYDGSGIAAMSLQDMYDTFVYPAIDIIAATNELFTINTSTTLTNYTSVSATPVFVDTRADTSLYSAADIPEALDQPTTITDYYLMRKDAGAATAFTAPVQIISGGNVQQYTVANFASLLSNAIRHAATSESGYTLSFNWNGVGTATGSVTNTILNGDGDFLTRFNSDILNASYGYNAQEVPNGTAVSTVHYLNINKG
jgi:hypothetical protein